MEAVKFQVEAKGVEQLITVQEGSISPKQAGLHESMKVQSLALVQQDRFAWRRESNIVTGRGKREERGKGGGEER